MERAFVRVLLIEMELADKIIGFGTFEPIRTGWVVKMNLPTFTGKKGMLDAMEIAIKTTKAMEGFKDGDLELWNVIEVFDKEEDAIKAGKESGQLFIYQIETSTFKWI